MSVCKVGSLPALGRSEVRVWDVGGVGLVRDELGTGGGRHVLGEKEDEGVELRWVRWCGFEVG